MTRDEQIRAAAIQQCFGSSSTAERKRRKWIEGAMWADAHPINRWKDAQGEDLPVYKTFTDIEQSKRLAEILPIDTADGYYEAQINPKTDDWEYVLIAGNQWASPEVVVPAWSLAALLDILYPNITLDHTEGEGWSIITNIEEENPTSILHDIITEKVIAETPIDACVEMIVKLHKCNEL